MKRILFSGMLMILLGCTGRDAATKQLPGVYTQLHTNRFGQMLETVDIRPLPGKDMFQVYVTKRSQTVVDGKESNSYEAPPAVLAKYDATHMVLIIEGEPEYVVDLNAATLKKGNGLFQKVK